ncbi:hypothetical protein GGR54DRAFT_617386 [Hypoxylon sp. NC1633]|nr:hypothetical protein GGR54DRAFT_617386 [Hypoxylon sp. NC1633]
MNEQVKRTNISGKDNQAMFRSYLTLFTTSVAGLNVKNPERRARNSSEQSNFRTSILDAYGLRGTGARRDLVWDVILGRWQPEGIMVASHLFSYRFTSATLTAIFGGEVRDELFSPKNGLMLHEVFEDDFESGFFAIVPDLPYEATTEERKAWRQSQVKEYKIRFIDKPTPKWVPGGKLTEPHRHKYNTMWTDNEKWSDVDGRKLQFLNDFRPRARYLYFVFCLNLLRFAYRFEKSAASILEPELRKFYWGSPKRYVRGSMLPGFMKEIGHKYHEIFEDPEGEEEEIIKGIEDESTNDVLREAATSQVLLRTMNNDDDDDESSSDEGDDGDDQPT